MPKAHVLTGENVKWFLLGAGAAAALLSASAAPPAPVPPAPPAAQQPNMLDLAAERYQTATKGYGYAIAGHQPGDAPGYDVIDWMRRRVRARLDLSEAKATRIEFIKQYVELLKAQEAFEEKMVKDRVAGAQALLRIRYDRLDAELLLASEERK